MCELEELLSRYTEAKSQEKKTKIMVVDDDPSIGRSLSKVFKEHEVVIANDGLDSLEKTLLIRELAEELGIAKFALIKWEGDGVPRPEYLERLKRVIPELDSAAC